MPQATQYAWQKPICGKEGLLYLRENDRYIISNTRLESL